MRQTAAEDEDEEEEDRMEEGVEDVVKLSRTKNADRRWKTTLPNIYGMSVPEFRPPPLKPVFMCSNYTNIVPLCQCRRYSSKEGKYVSVPQPSSSTPTISSWGAWMSWMPL